jgi:hypothetical protein
LEESVTYAVGMVSGGMKYVPGFMKFGADILKLLRGEYIRRQTHTDSDAAYTYLYFFKIRNVN